MTGLLHLPSHLLTSALLLYLRPALPALASLARTCKYLHRVTKEEALWKQLMALDYPLPQFNEKLSVVPGFVFAQQYRLLYLLERELVKRNDINWDMPPASFAPGSKLPRSWPFGFAVNDPTVKTLIFRETRYNGGYSYIEEGIFQTLDHFVYAMLNGIAPDFESQHYEDDRKEAPSYAELIDLLLAQGIKEWQPSGALIRLGLYKREHLLRLMASMPVASPEAAAPRGKSYAMAIEAAWMLLYNKRAKVVFISSAKRAQKPGNSSGGVERVTVQSMRAWLPMLWNKYRPAGVVHRYHGSMDRHSISVSYDDGEAVSDDLRHLRDDAVLHIKLVQLPPEPKKYNRRR